MDTFNQSGGYCPNCNNYGIVEINNKKYNYQCEYCKKKYINDEGF